MKATHGEHNQQKVTPAGQPVIGEHTIWWTFAGFLIGGFIGLLLGLSLGYGKFNLAGFAPLVAGGVGVPAFVFASFFAAMGGLSGALLALQNESRAASRNRHEGASSEPAQSHQGFIQRLPIYGAMLLALCMIIALVVIAWRAFGRGTASDQSNRVTWNQKNVARVGGAQDAETAAFVLQTAYPATRAENRPGTIVTVADDWRLALAATSLIASPVNAALMIYAPPGADANTDREIRRLTVAASSPTPSSSPGPRDDAVDDAKHAPRYEHGHGRHAPEAASRAGHSL